MTTRTPIPARRQRRLPLNGGRHPSRAAREAGRIGIAAARAALATVHDFEPTEAPVTVRLTADEIREAQRGLARARAALHHSV